MAEAQSANGLHNGRNFPRTEQCTLHTRTQKVPKPKIVAAFNVSTHYVIIKKNKESTANTYTHANTLAQKQIKQMNDADLNK